MGVPCGQRVQEVADGLARGVEGRVAQAAGAVLQERLDLGAGHRLGPGRVDRRDLAEQQVQVLGCHRPQSDCRAGEIGTLRNQRVLTQPGAQRGIRVEAASGVGHPLRGSGQQEADPRSPPWRVSLRMRRIWS